MEVVRQHARLIQREASAHEAVADQELAGGIAGSDLVLLGEA